MLVNEDTALTYSAVWSCVKIISETIASLPWHVYRQVDGDNKERATGTPTDWMLYRQPNPEITAFTFKEVMLAWALTWGNGYAEIQRDSGNRIVGLWPIPPHRVTPMRDDDGQLVYEVANENRDNVVLRARDMFHLHGLGYDGITGYSVVTMAARSIGLGMATEQFGSNYFENGAHPGVIVVHPKSLSEVARKNLKESMTSQYSGLGKSHRVMLLEEAIEVKNVAFSPEDSQFLETRKFQVEEIARWFRMPLHKMSDLERSTNNNIEYQGIEFATDTILPWVSRMEHEADVKFFSSSRGRLYAKLNMDSLLRGDTEARGKFYQIMANLGVFSVNDILRLEDMNTVGAQGEKRLVQLNQTTLEKIGEDPIAPPVDQPVEGEE